MLRQSVNISRILARLSSSVATLAAPKTQTAQTGILNSKKNPLTDEFGRHHTYLRISVTERCNLRCKYCMPEEGVNLSCQSELLTTEEILILADLFVRQGIRKVRLTGGEPTIRKDLCHLISGLKKLEKLSEGVFITTNGLMLTKQLVNLQRAGLDGLNISLDTLKPKKFEEITRRKGWERVMAGIDLALQLGFTSLKINCVVMKGINDDEILDFVDLTKDKNVDVRFIEYMPFDGNKWSKDKFVPFSPLVKMIQERHSDFYRLEDKNNDTAKVYKVPDYKGRVGFITSMSENFCGSCNRLRLTADGNLKVCLLGNTEVSLRDALRNNCSESDLIALISAALKKKEKGTCRWIITRPDTDFKKKQKILNFPLWYLMPQSTNSNIIRAMSTKNLTHTDDKGRAKMVDVSNKGTTTRTATAIGTIYVGPIVSKLIKENNLKKGDALSVARLAGLMAAKKTSELIPLCHNITLNNVQVEVELQGDTVFIKGMVKCDGKTGVEMEALTAVSIASLTVYDMCKAVSHEMIIKEIKLIQKTGGSRGDYELIKN